MRLTLNFRKAYLTLAGSKSTVQKIASKFNRHFETDLGDLHTLQGVWYAKFPYPFASMSWILVYSEVIIVILLHLGLVFFFFLLINFHFRKRFVPSFFLNYPCSDK